MIHDKIYPSSLDIAQAYARRTGYKKWQARRRKPMFIGKWVQKVAKAVGGRRGKLRLAPLYEMPMIDEDEDEDK